MKRPKKNQQRKAPERDRTGASKRDVKKEFEAQVQPREYPDIIDDTLDDSFPASDPPFWAGNNGSQKEEGGRRG